MHTLFPSLSSLSISLFHYVRATQFSPSLSLSFPTLRSSSFVSFHYLSLSSSVFVTFTCMHLVSLTLTSTLSSSSLFRINHAHTRSTLDCHRRAWDRWFNQNEIAPRWIRNFTNQDIELLKTVSFEILFHWNNNKCDVTFFLRHISNEIAKNFIYIYPN